MKPGTPRVVLLGDTSVGKTCLLNRIMGGDFIPNVQSTTAASSAHFRRDPSDPGMQIWDTAGMERYRSLNSLYYRNAVAGLLVFDVAERQSFDGLSAWYDEFVQNSSTSRSVYLVANKIDLREAYGVVSDSEIHEWCEGHQATSFFVSARTGENVRHMFLTVRERLPETGMTSLPTQQALLMQEPAPPKNPCC
jgi:small GTP-binding protein